MATWVKKLRKLKKKYAALLEQEKFIESPIPTINGYPNLAASLRRSLLLSLEQIHSRYICKEIYLKRIDFYENKYKTNRKLRSKYKHHPNDNLHKLPLNT